MEAFEVRHVAVEPLLPRARVKLGDRFDEGRLGVFEDGGEQRIRAQRKDSVGTRATEQPGKVRIAFGAVGEGPKSHQLLLVGLESHQPDLVGLEDAQGDILHLA